MRKLLFIFCLLFPICATAQNFKSLKDRADSLQKLHKYKKASKLYKKAIGLVLSYQEHVTDDQWTLISVADHDCDYYAYKKKHAYLCWEYGNGGTQLTQKINDLSAQGVKSLFTYNEWLGMTGPSIFIYLDPTTGNNVGLYRDARTLLVWATDKDVYFQEYSSSNIFKPMVVHNDTLRDILINHTNELIYERLKEEHYKYSEVPFYIFGFHFGQGLWKDKRLYDPQYLKNPEVNSKTYLSKLMPLMWHESKLYLEKATTGSSS